MARTITWLHLSDLHARSRDGWDARRITSSLVRDLETMQEKHGLRPDLVFFTGDAAFGTAGGEQMDTQYQKVIVFFDAVRKAFVPEIPLRDLYIVPGNHDVDREQITADQTDWLRHKDRKLIEITAAIRDGKKQWQNWMDRMVAYRRFLDAYGLLHLTPDDPRLIWANVREIAGLRVGIAGLNSAWSCADDDDKGRLWCGFRWQISTLQERIGAVDVAFALIHHPGNWFTGSEDPAMMRELRQAFPVVLHGHEHADWVDADAENRLILSAGACYQCSWMDNGYYIGQIDLEQSMGLIRLRQWDTSGGGWVARNIATKTQDGVWTIPNLSWLASRAQPDSSNRVIAQTTQFNDTLENSRIREERYGLVFGIPGYRIAYIPASREAWFEHYKERSMDDLNITRDPKRVPLDKRFLGRPLMSTSFEDIPRCRLNYYQVEPNKHLRLRFSETSYGDYLRSSEQLDDVDPFSPEPGRTHREEFLGRLRHGRGDFTPSEILTNICGVGLFILTADEHIVATTHSERSHVYPGRVTFSASGTMSWGRTGLPNPFTSVFQKAKDELDHLIDPTKVKLFAFGADARKFYFQFSFVEQSTVTFDEIRNKFNTTIGSPKRGNRKTPKELIGITLEASAICYALVTRCWEPAAEAALLSIAIRRFGKENIERELHGLREHWWKRTMRDEWDYRALRYGALPDSSVRYPRDELEKGEEKYANAVIAFVKDDVRGKRTVEIGPGTGRISIRLLQFTNELTCIDPSPAMLSKHRQRLGELRKRIKYEDGFAQDVLKKPDNNFDVAICSRVLIHNVGDHEFDLLVDCVCRSVRLVFIFEDVRQDRISGPATKLRSEESLLEAFGRHGFRQTVREDYKLFGDKLVFLRLARKEPA